jgi:cold shock CspA family protein
VPKKEDLPEMDKNRVGTVKFFNTEKGYGFITDNETKESVFVHINNLNEEVSEGNRVKFQIEMGPKGPMAVNVTVDK